MTDYKELYLLYCANLCADSNDYTTKKSVKRHNAAMKQLSKLFHQIEDEPDKSFLLELLFTAIFSKFKFRNSGSFKGSK